MNLLVENGAIEEMQCGSNFAYVLQDNSTFLPTEYKVLQSQTNSSFVRCMKMLYNGKIQLYYLVNSYRPLSEMLGNLEPESFLTIMRNILAGILEVKSNGFLACNGIDSSFEHIYVDQSTYKVGLVYLPISKHEYKDAVSFENVLRTNLVKIISSLNNLESPKTLQFSTDLQNGMLSLEAVYDRSGGKTHAGINNTVGKAASAGGMKLIAVNAPGRVVIDITKPEFTIGKRDTNDGVVKFNNMISRTHCKVVKRSGRYLISDLQSANGTYVNGARLMPNQMKELNNGDMVRMANSDFQVVIQ